MAELAEEDVLYPHEDIHALFCHYNSLYFGDSLGTCSVSWSSSRMTRCAGMCRYGPRAECEIRLSEPLLKFRPTADLKNTLLHEMIHAFLWIENQNKDHSDHGPNFKRLMNDINYSSIDDNQRPAGGYNITVYHDFHAEVDSYQVYRWMCESCGDLIKRAMNRAPSASDCIEKVKWHRHKMVCSGKYKKMAEPPGYEGKGSKGKHKQQRDGPEFKQQKDGPELCHASRKKAAKTSKSLGSKDESNVKKIKTITNFFPAVDTGNLDMDTSFRSGNSQKHLSHDNSKAIVPRLHNELVPEQISRLVRGHASRRKHKFMDVAEKCYGPGKYTVMSGWLDWYAEEEEGHEDIEPLINKRTERRKKQKLMVNSKRKVTEDETMTDTFTEDVDFQVTKDSVAAASQDCDRGAGQLKVSGFCRGMDGVHDLTEDNGALSLNDSGKVNILEISDD